MRIIPRGIVYILVACIFVLISLLTYTKVLSNRSVWVNHGPRESSVEQEFSNNDHFSNFGAILSDNKTIEQRGYNDSTHGMSIGYGRDAVRANKPLRLKIMVLARMRTGSTLLGEIFNQNQHLMYLFEPLHSTESLMQMRLMEPRKGKEAMSNLISKLSHCTFPIEFMHDIMKWGIAKGKSKTVRNICKASNRCSIATPNAFSDVCQRHKGNMAMKLIRADLQMVKPLIIKDNLNVKIIHLIRDPRGTANSRKGFYCLRSKHPPEECSLDKLSLLENNPKNYKYNTVHKLCQWMRETVQTALQRPEWLRGRYKLIRYEDLASDPLRLTKDIYSFLNLPLMPEVIQWVKANTQENTKKSTRTFSTTKNSTEAAMSWRNSLSFKEVKDIERKCGDVMQLLGYKPIKSENDLTNYTVSVTSPLDIGTEISLV